MDDRGLTSVSVLRMAREIVDPRINLINAIAAIQVLALYVRQSGQYYNLITLRV